MPRGWEIAVVLAGAGVGEAFGVPMKMLKLTSPNGSDFYLRADCIWGICDSAATAGYSYVWWPGQEDDGPLECEGPASKVARLVEEALVETPHLDEAIRRQQEQLERATCSADHS